MWKKIIKEVYKNNLIKNNSFDKDDIIEFDFITNLNFDEETNRLQFMIKHYIKKPKITRYITSNYVRTPIYEDYSERTKVVKKFNKIINPLKFVNEDILELNLQKKFILKIIDKIKIIPKWIVKLILDNSNYFSDSIINKSVLEPTFGNGAFLVEIVDRFINECENKKINKFNVVKLLDNLIYGIEINKNFYQKT